MRVLKCKNGQGLLILSIVIITFMEREKAEGMGIYYANEHAWWLVALDFSGFSRGGGLVYFLSPRLLVASTFGKQWY